MQTSSEDALQGNQESKNSCPVTVRLISLTEEKSS